MITRIFISLDLEARVEEIEKILSQEGFFRNHPDLLYFADEQKLGVEETKKIREFLSLKPYQAKGRAVVLVSAHNLTDIAQNSLLKTLEEPPEQALILLGTKSEQDLLPTILSRCQVEFLGTRDKGQGTRDFEDDIEKLIQMSMEERFEYIEKLEEKEEFLEALVNYFHKVITNPSTDRYLKPISESHLSFAKKLLKAQEWADTNGNIRAILEYLMIELPSI